MVADFCGLPWATPLPEEVAEKALVDAVETVSNYEMADDDEMKMLAGSE